VRQLKESAAGIFPGKSRLTKPEQSEEHHVFAVNAPGNLPKVNPLGQAVANEKLLFRQGKSSLFGS